MRIKLACVLAIFLGIFTVKAPSSDAYLYDSQSPAVGLRYRFTPAFVTMWGANGQARVNSGTASWNVQDLYATGRSFISTTDTSQSNIILPYNLAAGTRAQATLPCPGSGQGCFIRFNDNPAEITFYLGTNAPPPGQVDMWSVAAHEFGHWAGLGDLTTDDRPSSGNNAAPTMLQGVGGTGRRTIEQDDINAYYHTLPGAGNILANHGYEYASPLSWRHLAGPSGGSYVRYCDPANAFAGSCFIQFNGNGSGGASMYQDLIPRGPGASVVTPSLRVRNDSSVGVTVTLAIFWNNGVNSSSVNCSIAPNSWVLVGGTLSACPLSSVNTSNSSSIRFQIYNYGGGNVSIDAASMGAD